ncbi:hypothetical protein [Oscillibacter sp.]|uniref:hypothetical protein n=1 Tax=Oscillibacter sp. TaxID=1945593 RepID=UPI002628F335|nr:hypothetical protein [Oscillibacter sp.]MDD3346640.1 hypothetical protein [Oscillibacter sp.]
MMNYPTGAAARYGMSAGSAGQGNMPVAQNGAGQEWAGEVTYQPPGYNTNAVPGLEPGVTLGYNTNTMPGLTPGMTPMGFPTGQPMPQQMPGTGGRQTLEMSPSVPDETVENPTTVEEAHLGSLRALLMKNLGHYVVATFLVGTQSPVSWEGFLHSVGNDYLVIFQPDQGRYITGDFYSLKFVEFHDTAGVKPSCPGYRRRDGVHIW